MEKIIVKGVNKLSGEVDINSAKNSILPIIISTILFLLLISLYTASFHLHFIWHFYS